MRFEKKIKVELDQTDAAIAAMEAEKEEGR